MNSDRRTLRCISVALLLSLVLIAGCKNDEEEKEAKIAKHRAQADQYMASGAFKEAVIELKNLVQLSPGNDQAFYELGEARHTIRVERRKRREAIEEKDREITSIRLQWHEANGKHKGIVETMETEAQRLREEVRAWKNKADRYRKGEEKEHIRAIRAETKLNQKR